jgi:NADPH:quinone reductase-like Zn-dependent oxidoreductase
MRAVVHDRYGPPEVLGVADVERLLEAGKYRPVVDRTYPLDDVVEATRYVEGWQKTGNVVLTLNGASR